MPSHTLAFWENRIREGNAEAERSTVKKAAKLAKRRFETFTHEPTDEEMLEFYSSISYRDPTPLEAIRNINAEAAARRLAGAA